MNITALFNRFWQNEVIRFLFIGGLNTLFGYSAYFLLIYLGIDYKWSILLATILGALFNFFTTGRMVFKSFDNRLIYRFLILYGLIYCINVFIVRELRQHEINDYLAQAIALPLLVVVSYLLNKKLVFHKK